MSDLDKTLSFVQKYKSLMDLKLDDVKELVTKLNTLKFSNAVLLATEGMKMKEVLKEANITAGTVKKLNKGSIYFTSKMNYDYKPTSSLKGLKKVLKNGKIIYLTQEEYNESVENGKIVKKTKKSKKNKEIRSGEINCGSVYVDSVDSMGRTPKISEISTTSTLKDYALNRMKTTS